MKIIVKSNRPKENVIKPLGEQDLLPDGEQIYALEMTYNFNMVSL